jgi:sucrose-6-phosphate hydrolase SacC (GH32 family)
MEWVKKGLIRGVVENIPWAQSHAQVPTLLIYKDRLRVYFATRPQANITLTTFCDLDLNDFTKVIYIHDRPILELGKSGTFDQYGIMPSSIVVHDNVIYLYYSGWCRSVGVPYSNYTGLAQSLDGGITFKKVYDGPILDRTQVELFSATSPEVYYDGNWHMWYCSGTNWHEVNGEFEHTYDLKYASSSDGISWQQKNQTCIFQENEFEAITKPSVLKLGNKYHMWYCYRSSFNFRNGEGAYKIGYADSDDLVQWRRKDFLAGISLSESGWDSEMNAYPATIRIGNNIYLFYNGNSFGKFGFGYAQLKF